jgi:hypothetical protein
MTNPPFTSLIKHLWSFLWSISHSIMSMQGKIEVLLATMCRYDCRMFGNTWSSSSLTSGLLCGIYSRYSSCLILLNRSPNYGRITLDPVLSSVSPKVGDWTKYFFVDVLMTRSTLGVYSNCLVVPREEPSPISAYFSLGSLGEHLVVGFLSDILPTTRT